MNAFVASIRSLRARPAYTGAIVTTLALATGGLAAVFNVVDRLLVEPLPYSAPHQLVYIDKAWPLFSETTRDAAGADTPFAQLAQYEFSRVHMTAGQTPRVVRLARVTDAFFPALGFSPARGTIARTTDAPDAVVISATLSRSLFANDAAAIGQRVQLNGRDYRISAVMPPGFTFHLDGEMAEAFIPLVEDDGLVKLPQEMGSGAIARLKAGLDIVTAQAAMDVVFQRIAAAAPQYGLDDADRIRLVPLQEHWFGSLRRPLFMLLGAAACLLLIACANTAGLMVARAAASMKDTAIRVALGAGRAQLVRHALAESLVIGALAAVFGILLAHFGATLLIAESPVRLPIPEDGIGWRPLVLAVLAALITAGIAGLITAWQVLRGDLTSPLATGGRHGRFLSATLRRGLVAAQVAITVTLLINTALLSRSLAALRGENIGFDARNVLTMELAPADTKHPDAPSRYAYYQGLLSALVGRAGVSDVGIVNFLPLHSGSLMLPVTIADRSSDAEPLSWTYRAASPDYFRTMGIAIRAGRAFSEADRIGAPPAAIIDESAARAMAAGQPLESVIGRRFTVRLGAPTTVEIIGVAADIRQQGLGIASYPGFYVSAWQRPPSFANLVVRTSVDARGVMHEVQRMLQNADASLPVVTLRPLDEQVSETVARRRFALLLSGVLGTAALVLSVLGLAALMAQLVTYRTREIGVRVALGARVNNVVGLMVRQGLGMVAVGVALGVAGALASARLLTGVLYGVSASDPVAFMIVPLIVTGVAALACTVPTRRALRVDPMVALRSD